MRVDLSRSKGGLWVRDLVNLRDAEISAAEDLKGFFVPQLQPKYARSRYYGQAAQFKVISTSLPVYFARRTRAEFTYKN